MSWVKRLRGYGQIYFVARARHKHVHIAVISQRSRASQLSLARVRIFRRPLAPDNRRVRWPPTGRPVTLRQISPVCHSVGGAYRGDVRHPLTSFTRPPSWLLGSGGEPCRRFGGNADGSVCILNASSGGPNGMQN